MRRLSLVLRCLLLLSLAACILRKKRDETATTTTPDPTTTISDPTIGTVTFDSITTTGFRVNWSGQPDYQYRVFISVSRAMTTNADAETYGTRLVDWTTGMSAIGAGGFTSSTMVFVTVESKNSAGAIAIGTGVVTTACSGKIIFLANVSNGHMDPGSGATGVDRADSVCNANKPSGFSGSTFKAMIWVNGLREPCSNSSSCLSSSAGAVDWPVPINQDICNADFSMRIRAANSLGLIDPDQGTSLTPGVHNYAYTGLNINFTNAANPNCTNFSTSSSGQSSVTGNAGSSGQGFYSADFLNCNQAGTIYCLEQ